MTRREVPFSAAPGRFRKRPVEVSAIRWTGEAESTDAVAVFVGDQFRQDFEFSPGGSCFTTIFIQTLEGEMRVSPGDFVIRGTQGEFYPCKPAAFVDTFEETA